VASLELRDVDTLRKLEHEPIIGKLKPFGIMPFCIAIIICIWSKFPPNPMPVKPPLAPLNPAAPGKEGFCTWLSSSPSFSSLVPSSVFSTVPSASAASSVDPSTVSSCLRTKLAIKIRGSKSVKFSPVGRHAVLPQPQGASHLLEFHLPTEGNWQVVVLSPLATPPLGHRASEQRPGRGAVPSPLVQAENRQE